MTPVPEQHGRFPGNEMLLTPATRGRSTTACVAGPAPEEESAGAALAEWDGYGFGSLLIAVLAV